MTLDPADLIELIAARVVALLREEGLVAPAGREMIDAAEVAARLGLEAAWVRRNADRLGAVRIGDGSRPRLRFDPEEVAAALASRSEERSGPGAATPPTRRRRRAPVRRLDPAPLPLTASRVRKRDG